MIEEKPPAEGQHWTAPQFIDSKITEPPVGAWIDKDAVCRDCMKSTEEITMRRGFIDPIFAKEAEAKEFICARCGKKIPTGS